MNLNPIAANQTEVTTAKARILFSYRTPVACFHEDGNAYRTEKHWSVTTSRHINKFLGGAKAETKPQAFFDRLA